MASLGWSVLTIKFQIPMDPQEPRWLRLCGKTGILPQNVQFWLERELRKACGILRDSFEIAGPVDVKYRLVKSLNAASLSDVSGIAGKFSLLKLQSLHHKLLSLGVMSSGTKTEYVDWRINVFGRSYRRYDQPSAWGDVVIAGALHNQIITRDGRSEYAFQWKAGKSHIPNPKASEMFGARLQAYIIPSYLLALPWVTFALALLALFTRPDVLGFLRRIMSIIR